MSSITVASIDIGMTNFAQYIGRIDRSVLDRAREAYQSLPKPDKYNAQRLVHPDAYMEIIYTIASGLCRVQTGVYNFIDENEKKPKYTQCVRERVIHHLVAHTEYFSQCDHIVIEQQMSNMRQSHINMNAIKLAETALAWFTFYNMSHSRPCTIESISSNFKTKYLHGKEKFKYSERKHWATRFYRHIIQLQDDKEMMNVFQLGDDRYRKHITPERADTMLADSSLSPSTDAYRLGELIVTKNQKMDDISDTVVQLVTYLMIHYVM